MVGDVCKHGNECDVVDSHATTVDLIVRRRLQNKPQAMFKYEFGMVLA